MSQGHIEKSVTINASPEAVRTVLTQDKYVREWASAFAPNTYAVTSWEEGAPIEWKTNEETCVKGILTTYVPNHKQVSTFYDNLPEGGFTETLGEMIESYTLTQSGTQSILDIYSGPYSEKDRERSGDEMSFMRDKALHTIKLSAESIHN